MEHQYSNTALSILRDLAVLDRYQRSSDRPDYDEFAVTAGNVSLFEIFLSRFLDDFLDLDQQMMRNGQRPLEIHIETGAGASRVNPSALLAALWGESFLSSISAPEIRERFNVPDWLVFLLPFLFVGEFGEARGSIVDLNLRPASEEGDITIAWNVAQQGLVISLQFETAGIEIRGQADIIGGFEVDITELEASILLKPVIRAGRLLWELEVNAQVSLAERDVDVERKIRSQFENMLKDLLKDNVNLICAVLGAVPLHPVEESPGGLANLAGSFNLLGLETPTRLQETDRTQLFAALVLDGLNQSIYNAALLPSNFRHLLPPEAVFVDLALNTPPTEVPRIIELFARRHLELAHLVNRTDAYTDARIEEDEHSGEAYLIVEHEPLPHVPDEPGIECMRYRVALEEVSFRNPDAAGTTRVECSIEVWHPLLGNQDDIVDEDEVAELDILESTSEIVLGNAGLNCETICFLEWGGKLRLQGMVEANVLGGTEEFVHDIDITRDTGFFIGNRETETGHFTPLEDPDNPESGKFTIHYRLQQLPYAKAYDWVRVSFNKIELPPISWMSQFPQGVSLLIEAFVNRDRNEDDGNTAPFRRDFNNYRQSINLTDWHYDVVYPEDDVGSELSIELRAVFIDPANNEEIAPPLVASRVIPRFSNEQLEEVLGDDLIEAAANGAVAEWGIPVGLPATAFVMTDEEEQLRVTVTLRNEQFDPDEVPTEFKPKTFDIEFPSVFIENDTDHGLSGEAEIRFSCAIGVVANGATEPTPIWSGDTRVLEAEDPVERELPGPPGKQGVLVRPGDELLMDVSGLDFDWPPLDPHDRLGTATLRVTVPEGDELDHRNVGLLKVWSELARDRDVHNFEARIQITTTSKPPAPRFFFQGLEEDVTEQEVPAGTSVTLEYDGLVEWATSGRVAKSTDNGANWEEEAPLNTDDPADTFEVTVNQTTQYRLEVTNVAGTTLSRVLTVRVP